MPTLIHKFGSAALEIAIPAAGFIAFGFAVLYGLGFYYGIFR